MALRKNQKGPTLGYSATMAKFEAETAVTISGHESDILAQRQNRKLNFLKWLGWSRRSDLNW